MKKVVFLLGIILCSLSLNAQDFFDDVEPTSSTQYRESAESTTLRTERAGNWGTRPRPGNVAQYMYANFQEVFPEGLTLGADDKTILFTNSRAITRALPSFGTPRKIVESLVDPTARELSNSFASKVAALTMVVKFDRFDKNFATSPHEIGTCAFREGICSGMTVDRLLAKANLALAGKNAGYPIKVLDKMVAVLLASYQSGTLTDPILIPGKDGSALIGR